MIYFYIKVLGNNHIVYPVVHTLHQSVILLVLNRSTLCCYIKIFYQRSELSLKLGTVVKHDFSWMQVPE